MSRNEALDYIKKTITKKNNNLNEVFSVGYPCYDEKEIIACLDALLELNLSQGKHVRKFEKEFTKYLGCGDYSYACACNSGSSANLLLFATLLSTGVLNEGDKIIVPAATFATVSSPLYQLGLIPVYVDCSLETFCVGNENILEAINLYPEIKACMVVHNLGFSCDMNELKNSCKKNNIILIEDCCEAHGGVFDGKKLGSFGDFSTWSFFVAHNITTGEGGIVVSNNGKYESTMRSIREFGRRTNAVERYEDKNTGSLGEYDTRYIFDRLGYNIRMTDYAAAMGIVQLSKLDSLNQTRRNNAKKIMEILNGLSIDLEYLLPNNYLLPAYYGFPMLIQGKDLSRNKVCSLLESEKIETRPNMGGCLPCQPGFENQNHIIVGDLSNSKKIKNDSFFIGVHSGLKEYHFSKLENVLRQLSY